MADKMAKKRFTIRMEEKLIDKAKELAAKNKKKLELPNNYNQMIQLALKEYLTRNKA